MKTQLENFRQEVKTQKKTKTRAGNLFKIVANGKTVNYDGYPAYRGTLESDFLTTVMCNICKDTYYVDKRQLIENSLINHIKMFEKDPEFHLRATIYSRQKGNMKLQPILGAAMQSTYQGGKGFNKEWMLGLLNTFPAKRVLEWVELLKSGSLKKGFGRSQKELVIDYLAGLSLHKFDLYSVKYKSVMRDLSKLVHPAMDKIGKEKFDMLGYCLDKKEAVGKMQQDFEKLKTLKGSKFADFLVESRIPWDVTTAMDSSAEAWFARMTTMTTGSLLGNIRTLERHKVMGTSTAKDVLKSKLNKEAIEKGRILPIQVMKAWMMASNSTVKTIIKSAWLSAWENKIPELRDQRILVAVDTSGSMSGDEIFHAVGMASTMLASAKNARVLGFAGDISYDMDTQMSTVDLARDIWDLTECPGGWTEMNLPISQAMRDGQVYDKIVYFTDMQENTGSPVYKKFKGYQKSLNPEAKLIFVNLESYDKRPAPSNDPDVLFVNGFSPAILELVKHFGKSQEQAVKDMNIDEVLRIGK